jgi:hypothetical protein
LALETKEGKDVQCDACFYDAHALATHMNKVHHQRKWNKPQKMPGQ